MDDVVGQTVSGRRFQMQIAAAFGISALLLAALGIYGVVGYGVALRRREIGIRLALGARPAQVRRAVMIQGLRPVAAGLIAGLAAALAAGKLIRGLLFGVAPNDPLAMAGVALALLLVAALGCMLPARSATRFDPVHTLRED
jgi:ABC-type antimicrobial peptide transport system permease subunit